MTGRFGRARVGRIAGFVAAAAGLAVVISVVAAVSSPRKAVKPSVLPPSVAAQRLVAQAEDAASKYDTETALGLARRAVAIDPSNQAAVQLRESLASSADSSAPASDSDSAPAAFTKSVANMSVLLPASFKSWKRGELLVQPKNAVITFEPGSGDSDFGRVVRVSMYATDGLTSSKAASMARGLNKRAYPKNRSSVSVGIVSSANFGTDGKQLAAVSFARGRFAFEVIVAGTPGVNPSTLKLLAVQAAAAVPAAQ